MDGYLIAIVFLSFPSSPPFFSLYFLSCFHSSSASGVYRKDWDTICHHNLLCLGPATLGRRRVRVWPRARVFALGDESNWKRVSRMECLYSLSVYMHIFLPWLRIKHSDTAGRIFPKTLNLVRPVELRGWWLKQIMTNWLSITYTCKVMI